MVKKNKAVFFDRDGTLIKTFISKNLIPKAIKNVKDFKLMNYSELVINKLKRKFLIIVITNQPDVSRGLNTKVNVININNKLSKCLKIDKIYTCYSSNNKYYMRKPNPGMIYAAKRKFNLNLRDSFVIGDRDKDIICGKSAGCKTILLKTKYNSHKSLKPNFTITSLKDILNIIKF